MAIFDKLFKRKKDEVNIDNNLISNDLKNLDRNDGLEEIVFMDNELVDITVDGVIDTTSPLAIKKFKHNLEVLVKRAKEKGNLDKFMIIRDDDFFPIDYEWRVSADFTCLEKGYLELPRIARDFYALEKANLLRKFNGITLPYSYDELDRALSQVNKEIGLILSPVRFRSTKHFTINTPLGVTGDYNAVATNRNFTILDNIQGFLNSGYGYSVSYHDAYLDVTHESLPVSNEAVVLIEKSKYESIIKDPIICEQLKQRRVVLYVGDEKEKDGEMLAINMLLTELGILPSQIGQKYFFYDNEVSEIIDRSIKKLAKENGLLFDKSHSGENGHFTDYYDEKNYDYAKSVREYVNFLRFKFPDMASLFTERSVNDSDISTQIVEKIGAEPLLEATKEYNSKVEKEFNTYFSEYKKDRKSITPEVSEYFKSTLRRISDYYNNLEQVNYSYETQREIEENIRHFYQDKTVKEQIIAAKELWKTLANTLTISEECSLDNETSLNI